MSSVRYTSMFEGRSTGDVVVILMAGTVCLALVVILGAVAVVEVTDPDADTGAALSAVSQVLATLLSLVAGYLAGRAAHG